MKLIGTMRTLDDGLGAVRVEDVFDTGIDDLWDACTTPDRLRRWIAEVSGDLRVGGGFRARFTSGWEGTGRIDVCEPPRRLVVLTREEGEPDDHVIEATLTPEGKRTVLVIEDVVCRSSISRPTEPGGRCMSRTWPPTWPGGTGVISRCGGPN